MAQNGTVIDELVVKLRLDATEYKKADKEVDQEVTKTEKKRTVDGEKAKKRDTAAIKRTKEAASAARVLGAALTGVAAVGAVLFGAGALAFNAAAQLASMETGLRRAAVSTNMSNREMQAWGSTARRLGADAQAGATAIADLAKEQQQFNITGQAPTMMALARLGVRATPDTPIADMLGQAQQIYRGSSPAQQKQIEAGLAAQGVSNDLIVMIKSETDAREAYTRSFAESASENRKALDAVTESLTSMASAAVNVANTIATVIQPAVEVFAKWVGEGAQALSAFNDRMIAAGGGLEGFTRIMSEEFPRSTAVVTKSLTVLGEAVDIAAWGLTKLWESGKAFWEWINKNIPSVGAAGSAISSAAGSAGDWIAKNWNKLAGEAREKGPAPVANWLKGGQPAAGQSAPVGVSNAQDMMSRLVIGYGLTVPQAAAVAANMGGESNFNPAAFNAAGGGTGARGLLQLRGARSQAFMKKYGVMPNQASIDQQLEFMFTDPYERGLLNRVMGSGKSSNELGEAFSTIFEAHGNAAETARRGKEAARLANSFSAPAGSSSAQAGNAINIQTVNVQANNPNEFVGSIQRVAGPQNYNSGVR